ncbi:hypothetical protein [Escherichia coli]|uniref:Uncharacterized protein n=2 Tax=Enterobacteriaceae TaxID=543 RepID=A0ABC8E833_ECOLX|nr:hypothetical protein [Escherichia coli]EAQ9951571.1 hypothetical protein [Salmonella enterica]EGI9251205.1 hypothetical protein [Salmonella enterica subsp. enterica serovar Typhimurium]ETX73932.1 hypothetical protein P804_05031 [Escherichia coli BIDMC 43b]ETX80455.1 hypothetical protein P803_05089 [Escherichia coli BIDMC 43a]HAE4638737.1 hypothetical protein [Salmonella enterica subsp. enterica serovar Muenchen]
MNQNEINPSIKIDKNPNKGNSLSRWLAYIAIVISIISLVISFGNFKIPIFLYGNNDLGEDNTVHYKQNEKWDTCLNGFAFSTGRDGDLKPVYKYPFIDSETPVQGVRVLCGQKKKN